MANERHDSVVVNFSPAARRRLAQLSIAAATALYEHLTGPVARNPHRLGKPLDPPFEGVWTTVRGQFRALYLIDDREAAVTVLAVAHRRDAYRPR
ncbi:MAG: type II toxin-antitoxin system RelE/ParE family toxin [Actinobacteria bacterium]|nr:type II toxin-antitoxin system RelE/ParE family toxin [Actinomycetota bacterium]